MKKKMALDKRYVNDLLERGEKIGVEEIQPSVDNFFPDYIDGPKYDIWMNEVNIFNERYLKDYPIYDCIKNTFHNHKCNSSAYNDMIGYLRVLEADDQFWEEIDKREIKMGFRQLPKDSERILEELVHAENPSDYLSALYQCARGKEQDILHGIIKELSDKGFIDVIWADNCPFYVTINNSARTYNEQLIEQDRIEICNHQTILKQLAMYDVFISHANKDKNEYVNRLKESLDKLGICIFYDKDTLEWGDIWKDKILEGVSKAEFAIIVISENFFDREWTEKELTEFLGRQNSNGQKIILPILHNITPAQLKEKYPDVADIQSLNSSDYSCDEIALKFAGQLIKRLKN